MNTKESASYQTDNGATVQDARKPQGWNQLHDAALSLLSRDETHLTQLRTHLKFNGAAPFDDLVTWGAAKVRHEPIYRNGIACGSRTFFRLA